MRSFHLQVLQLPESATKDEIKSAYRELSKRYHPDVNSATDANERFLEIKAAYEYLTDEKPDAQLHDYFNADETQQPNEEELWRREQRRKNREREIEKERQQILLIRKLVDWWRPMAGMILICNVLLTIDYLLPFEKHDQEIVAVAAGYETSRNGSYYRYDRVIFEDFEMKFDRGQIPDVRNYEKAEVEATRIFGKPMATYLTIDGSTNRYQQIYNVYIIFGYVIPLALVVGVLFFYLKKAPHRLNAAVFLTFLFIFQLIFFISQ